MLIDHNNVVMKGYEILTQKKFSELKGKISFSAINYLMLKDKIDYTEIGGSDKSIRYVVLTEKSKSYQPNSHKARVAVLKT